MRKTIQIPYTFNLLNWAAVAGLFHFIKKTAMSEVWLHRRIGAFPHGVGR